MENTNKNMPFAEAVEKPPSNKKKYGWLGRLFLNKADETLRESIEELIEEDGNGDGSLLAEREKTLLANILQLRDITVEDVMIPRADIIAVEDIITKKELLNIYAQTPRSRLPIYQDTLDHIRGTVHIKDFLGQIARKETFDLTKIIREVTIVSPSLSLLDLLLQMQQTKNHMALIIDEFGGIDGLVTLGDVIEAITGEIDDIYDTDTSPKIKMIDENNWLVDARVAVEDFEDKIGLSLLGEEEREEIDTMAGLLLSIAGRVPAKGELTLHDEGFEFQVIEGDIRSVRKIQIKKLNKPVMTTHEL